MPRKAESKRPPAKQSKPKPKNVKRPPSPKAAPPHGPDMAALAEELNEALNAPREDEPDLIPTREWGNGYVLEDGDTAEAFLKRKIREWCERDARFAAGKETPEDVEKERQEVNLRVYAAAEIEARSKKHERAAARRRKIENGERASYGLPPLEDVKAGSGGQSSFRYGMLVKWFKNHPARLAIIIAFSLLIVAVLLGWFVPAWRSYAWSSAVLVGLVLVILSRL